LKQNVGAIRHCAVTIGRIAAADDQYVKEIEHNDGIKIMAKVIDMPIPEVQAASIDALNRIAESEPNSIPRIAKLQVIPKVLSSNE